MNLLRCLPKKIKELDQIIILMNQYPDHKLQILAHSSDVGREKDNLRITKARAKAIRVYLEKRGIPKSRIIDGGYGKKFPVFPNDDIKLKSKNNRIEVLLSIPRA